MTVPTTVIQQFLHPPIGVMAREMLPNAPFTGRNSFQRLRGPVGVAAYGIGWTHESHPPGYGIVSTASGEFFDRKIVSIRVLHRLLDGSDAWTQEFESNEAVGYILFIESFPWLVDTELAPGIVSSWYWLVL